MSYRNFSGLSGIVKNTSPCIKLDKNTFFTICWDRSQTSLNSMIYPKYIPQNKHKRLPSRFLIWWKDSPFCIKCWGVSRTLPERPDMFRLSNVFCILRKHSSWFIIVVIIADRVCIKVLKCFLVESLVFWSNGFSVRILIELCI